MDSSSGFVSPILRLLPAFPSSHFPEIVAFFTTRGGGESPAPFDALNLGFRTAEAGTGEGRERIAANWRALLREAGLSGRTVRMPALVHGETLVEAEGLPDLLDSGLAHPGADPEEPVFRQADAVFTGSKDLVIAVTAADCLPVLLFDPEAGIIAAVHAGWRGTAAGILEKTLRNLMEKRGLQPRSTRVSLGPCIGPGAFEIGPEAAARLDPRFTERRNGLLFHDLRAANRAQALASGIPERNIEVSPFCTFTNPGLFFSHRRDGGRTGRMAALIAIR